MTETIKYFETAGITFEIRSDLPITSQTFQKKFQAFEVSGPGKDTVTIHHHFTIPDGLLPDPSLKQAAMVFSNDFLTVYRTGRQWIYEQKRSDAHGIPHNAIVRFNQDHTLGHVYTAELDPESYATANLGSVVMFGGDHYLMANLLADRNGMLVHANGLAWNQKGVVLIGRSGAGKSTLSGMLTESGFDLVADDRIILIQKKDQLILAGSWCHGSVARVTNTRVRVCDIYFLVQSPENRIIAENSIPIKLKLVADCLVRPFAGKLQWEKVLKLLESLMNEKIFYTLYFDLSKKICPMIKERL